MYKDNEKPPEIYHVQGVNVDHNYHIAYATGDIADIRKYYDDKKGYGLIIDLIKPVHILHEEVIEKENLLKEKAAIEKRLAEIQAKLK